MLEPYVKLNQENHIRSLKLKHANDKIAEIEKWIEILSQHREHSIASSSRTHLNELKTRKFSKGKIDEINSETKSCKTPDVEMPMPNLAHHPSKVIKILF